MAATDECNYYKMLFKIHVTQFDIIAKFMVAYFCPYQQLHIWRKGVQLLPVRGTAMYDKYLPFHIFFIVKHSLMTCKILYPIWKMNKDNDFCKLEYLTLCISFEQYGTQSIATLMPVTCYIFCRSYKVNPQTGSHILVFVSLIYEPVWGFTL